MGKRAMAVAIVVALWPVVAIADELCPTPKAVTRGETLPSDPAARADTLMAKAIRFFDEKDYAAAAITYAQAARAYDGLPDEDAHAEACRWLARSNSATAYARAEMPVEALAAFEALANEPELPALHQPGAALAITELKKQVGTLVLEELPDAAEVRLDGLATTLDAARAPIPLAEGKHVLEVEVRYFRTFVREVEIIGEQTARVQVEMVESDEVARVRVEANRPRARVEVDGEARGEAPRELTLTPGLHEFVVTAPTFRTHRTTVKVEPGERTILHVDLVAARSPWGVRAELYGMMIAGLGPAPFDVVTPAAGALIFHPYLRFRSVWFGVGVEVHARTLDDVGAGGMVKWCPGSMQFWRGTLAWCPAVFAGYLTAPHEGDDELQSGNSWIRLGTSVELRAGPFAFVRATPTVERMVFASSTDPEIWATGLGLQLSAGIEL